MTKNYLGSVHFVHPVNTQELGTACSKPEKIWEIITLKVSKICVMSSLKISRHLVKIVVYVKGVTINVWYPNLSIYLAYSTSLLNFVYFRISYLKVDS